MSPAVQRSTMPPKKKDDKRPADAPPEPDEGEQLQTIWMGLGVIGTVLMGTLTSHFCVPHSKSL